MPCGSYNKKTKKKKKKSNKKSRVATLACAVIIGIGCFSFNIPKSISPSEDSGFYTPSMNDIFAGMSENLNLYHGEHYEGYQ